MKRNCVEILFCWLVFSVPANAAPPAPTLRDLTPPVRERVDRLAAGAPVESLKQDQINFGGSVAAWLVSRTSLTAAEEKQAADIVHSKITGKSTVLPTSAAAQRVFDQLLAALPPHLKSSEFQYRLIVLDESEPNAFAIGGGYVYLHRALLTSLLADPERGPDALAFVLGHELGHGALEHCRRGYQLLKIQEALKAGIDAKLDAELLKAILQTTAAPAGVAAQFLYTREQEYEADLFALHLCRNAGLTLERVLDGARWLVLLRHPEAAQDPNYVPRAAADNALWYYLSSHPDPLRRLRRLQMELAGTLPDESSFGLFVWDATTGQFTKAQRAALGSKERALVLVHGLRGSEDAFSEMLEFLKDRPAAERRSVLVFRWPNNGSLAHAAMFLKREMARVIAAPDQAVFICHSAGGLVFRAYAEKESGKFERAIFLGTPHGGSDLSACKCVVDCTEFVGSLNVGLPDAIPRTIREGHGQIRHDLHPDSLFLRWLGRQPPRPDRYHVFAGQYLGTVPSTSLRVAFIAGKEPLKKIVNDQLENPWLRAAALRFVDSLTLPEEMARGDLVVSVESAKLEGVPCQVLPKVHHLTIKSDAKVLQRVWEVVCQP